MSILSLVQDAADEVGLNQPSTLIGSPDQAAIRMLSIVNRVGRALARKKWDQLIKEATITTADTVSQYALPSDYASMIADTAWNQTERTQVFMISPQHWSYEKSVLTTNYHDRMRLIGEGLNTIGQRVTIHPTPTATETIRYEYHSKNWLTDATGTTEYSAVNADTDLPVFDEELMTLGVTWRLLKSIGQPYLEEKTEFDMNTDILLAQSGGSEVINTDGNKTTLSNLPETGFGI